MFTVYNDRTRFPLKIWLNDAAKLDEKCLEQAYHLAQLPFIHRWVALMPDTHVGAGMPIGGVIAATDVIIPNAVGKDIGCGMAFIGTNVPIAAIAEIPTGCGTLLQAMISDILRNIPVGFAHHKKHQPSAVLDRAQENRRLYEGQPALLAEMDAASKQVGTLGGGNHFIELQIDDEGNLGIMLHSGSRHLGHQICDYFHQQAGVLNRQWYSDIPEDYSLAFLPIASNEGQAYLNWMNLALDFAYENRAAMMTVIQAIVEKWLDKYTDLSVEFREPINCHHNYAALENHYGRDVWVHRKGATRARQGEIAIIPGAMGAFSYLVSGAGNPESFCSSSHGAGRQYSRKGALKTFSREEVLNDLKDQGIVLGKHNKADVAEESRYAYKDIDDVMANQQDLVTPIKRLKTLGVVKG